jgi:NADPH-dependent 2,4-dienoyl-CoA reductase/sulfur reductase-like enzyme/nitrite reductase/ring-hydroxylating ferredoxin subunit
LDYIHETDEVLKMNNKEIIAAKVDELNNGEMKKIEVDDHKILLSRIEGKYYALGGTCPHYGASLNEGVLSGERIYCPLHHARFNAKTGDLEEPPTRDSLWKYPVKIRGENVVLELPEKIKESRVPEMTKYDPEADNRTFVIIGAGAAGNIAAQTLREDGFQGRIIMITKENRLPYDRPDLSKAYLKGEVEPEWMPLRSKKFFEAYDIEIMLQKRVTSVKPKGKNVTFENGESLHYDKLLLATGSIPRNINVPGANLKNIYTLRSWDDADMILKASETAVKAAVIGASFIGMEVADSLTKRKLSVTVIALDSVPFERIFGKEIGNMFQQLHIENGVDFRLSSKIVRFEGNGKVKAIILEDGEKIKADLVILGIGVIPATDFLNEIDLLPDGSVKVNEYFEVQEDIYAAGDIATFIEFRTNQVTRIEHWRTALQQGRCAAHNMAGIKQSYNNIPFFWTSQAGLNLRYVGHTKEWDEIIIQGGVKFRNFIAYFVKNGKVRAFAGNNRDQEMDAAEELMRRGRIPSVESLRQGGIDLVSLVK